MIKELLVLLCTIFVAAGAIADEAKPTPRECFSDYFQAMDNGQRDTADALKTTDCSDSLHMSLRKLKIFERTKPFYELSTSNRALVVAHPYTILSSVSDRQEVIYALLHKQDDVWRIRKLGRTSPEHASWLMRGFLIHSDVKLDLSTQALVGDWRYPCASSVVLKADGTGTEMEVGPVGPHPDQKPEPFTWTLKGSTLNLRFADRKEHLVITSIDHKGMNFKEPNKTDRTRWWRRKATKEE